MRSAFWIFVIVFGLAMMGVGCDAIKQGGDFITGTHVDPVTGKVTQDPGGGALGLVTGLMGLGNVGLGLAGLWGNIRRKQYRKIAGSTFKTVRRLYNRRREIKDADGKSRMAIFVDEGKGFIEEFKHDQEAAEIHDDAREIVNTVGAGKEVA
jgi:hypothetical protein